MTTERPPAGLKAAGKRLWHSVADDYQLETHEARLLLEAARTADLLDRLEAEVRSSSVMVDSPQGLKMHPAIGEIKNQRITLTRLLAALRMPQGEEGDEKPSARPQRRSGPRGVYGVRPA